MVTAAPMLQLLCSTASHVHWPHTGRLHVAAAALPITMSNHAEGRWTTSVMHGNKPRQACCFGADGVHMMEEHSPCRRRRRSPSRVHESGRLECPRSQARIPHPAAAGAARPQAAPAE